MSIPRTGVELDMEATVASLAARVTELEGENAGLALDLARARDRITRVTRERDAHHRAYTDADARALQLQTQLDSVGDHLRAQLAACLAESQDEPGQRHLAAAVRQVRHLHDHYTTITGSTP
ncbi:hypothetical protein [Glycomyces tenuis]|uniref:hypothetical protein n=1 Tax=Glycomyces tenuis TaxID=58116 RepID=UPI00040E2A2C|nr:hypothetical protein [Glycomyces tenuis]